MSKNPKKSSKRPSQTDVENPLAQVEELNVKEIGKTKDGVSKPTAVYSKPTSPLGPPQKIEKLSLNGSASQSALNMQDNSAQVQTLESEVAQLKQANKRLEKRNIELETAVKLNKNVEESLKEERQQRLDAERSAAAAQAQLENHKALNEMLESVRSERLELEKKVASLSVRAERTQEIAIMLREEQEARQKLEKEKASLDVQVESLKKLDTLLSEERQARMNAQSRAASSEAQLARLEGEIKNSSRSGATSGSLLDRLRGK